MGLYDQRHTQEGAPQLSLTYIKRNWFGSVSNPDAARSDGLFEILGRAESYFLAGFNLDGFTSGWVPPHTRRPIAHFDDAQAVEADALALLEMLGNVHDHFREHGVRLGLCHAVTLCQSR